MKKLLSLVLTLAMLASSIIAVSATTETIAEETLPVVSYIDNWDFDSADDAPTSAFQALPENVTEDGVSAGKFDAYTNGKNTGFITSSWAELSDDYAVFDLRIKADKTTTKSLHLIDANVVKFGGTWIEIVGFSKIMLEEDTWSEITLVLDISEKSVADTGAVSNIVPVSVVVNGKRYSPANTNTMTISNNRRNFIEPAEGDIIYMDYYKTYTTTAEAVTELLTDREAYLVSEYIDNWDFGYQADRKPTSSWQQLPVFENGIATFDTYTSSKHPCFDHQTVARYIDGTNRFAVLEFSVKYDEETATSDSLRIWNSALNFNGTRLSAPGFNNVNLTPGSWHEVVYVMDLKDAVVDGTSVTGIKPYLMYIDNGKYKPDNSNTFNVDANSAKTWIQRTANNNSSAEASDVIYMDYYKTYIADTTEVEEDATYLKPAEPVTIDTYYTVDTMLQTNDFNAAKPIPPSEYVNGTAEVTTESWSPVWNNDNKPTEVEEDGLYVLKMDSTVAASGNCGFFNNSFSPLVTAGKKYAVVETKLKWDENSANSFLRMLGSALDTSETDIEGLKVDMSDNEWHEIVVLMDISNASVVESNAANISGATLEYLIFDDLVYTYNSKATSNITTWNYMEVNKGICYLDYFRIYAPTEADVAAKHPASVTRYTPVNIILNYDYNYQGDMGAYAFGSFPVIKTVDGRGAAEFNSNNTYNSETGGYGNIGIYGGAALSRIAADDKYVVLETGFKYGDTDATNVLLYNGIIRLYGNGDEAQIGIYGDNKIYSMAIDRNVWYDTALVLDCSALATDGTLNAEKLVIGESEFDLSGMEINWNKKQTDSVEQMYMSSKEADTKLWLDYYKAYTVTADVLAFEGTSKYTMDKLIYSYEFDKKAGGGFGLGEREVVTLEDGTNAIKLIGSTGATQKNAGFEIYAGDGTGTVVVEARIMIPENDGAGSYVLANYVGLAANAAGDALSVKLYDGPGRITEVSYGDWHTFELVIDTVNKRYITLKVDDETYEIEDGYRAPNITAGNGTRYYVEAKTDATLETPIEHIMYMDYMKSYKIKDYLAAPTYTEENGKINVSIDVNTEIKDVDEAIMVVLYDGEKLVSVTNGTYDAEAGTVTATVNVPSAVTNASVKVLGWSDLGTLKPIMAADTYPKA